MDLPSISTSPAVGCSNPAISRRQVVLPEPDGPSMEKNSPWAMSKLSIVGRAHFAVVPADVAE